MKPIHNYKHHFIGIPLVVIPHKVNDLNETNSQHSFKTSLSFFVVIPHKVNDLNETNSQQ